MLVLSHHKCASVAVGAFLGEFCRLNGMTFFDSHYGGQPPSAVHDVNFLRNSDYHSVFQYVDSETIHIIRNPLSIVQSAYYSHLRTHSLEGWPELEAQRIVLGKCSLEEGLFLTVAFCEREDFYRGTRGPLSALRRWNFSDRRMVTLRVEDLSDMTSSFRGAFQGADQFNWPDHENYTFRALSGGRVAGQINDASHFRSGDDQAWRRVLPPAIIAYVREHYRDVLEQYYPDALSDVPGLDWRHQA